MSTATTFCYSQPCAVIQERISQEVDGIMERLRPSTQMLASERRGIIGRYTAVLEGNFIYWMTGTYLGVRSEEAKEIIRENLQEEIKQAHPAMLRRFAQRANAVPTDIDAAAVAGDLLKVRSFVSGLEGTPLLITMAFFENFIQRFMPYLADIARLQGSSEFEYTDVHGICDITHTQELYKGLEAELANSETDQEYTDVFYGIRVLRSLIDRIVTA